MMDRSSNSMNCSSSMRISGRRCSLALSMEDGSCHDLTNLSLKDNVPEKALYPQRQHVRRLPEIDDAHTLRLWEPLPKADAPFRRSCTTTTCSQKEEERITPQRPSPQQLQRRPTLAATPVPAPVVPPPVVVEETPAAAPVVVPPPPTAAAAAAPARPACQINEPGPRPKVNYKKLYGAGDSPSRRDLRNSNRHISFQEQQLQKTLEEEERLKKEQEKISGVSSSTTTDRTPTTPTVIPEEKEEPVMPALAPLPTPVARPQEPERQSLVSRMTPPSYAAPPPAAPRPPSPSNNSQTVMEIAPNLFVPYKGSHETWEAVQRGQFTVTTCFACCLQLVVIDTAEFLVCPDCHTVSPLSYGGDCSVERCGVGLGIKREWCDTEAALPAKSPEQPSIPLQPYPTTTTSTNSSTSSYHQRHHEKSAKYEPERSPSPEQQQNQWETGRQATYLY